MQTTPTDRGAVPDSSRPQAGWIFDLRECHEGGTTAEILEVLHVPGYRQYRVRWENGLVSTFLPSSDHWPHPPPTASA